MYVTLRDRPDDAGTSRTRSAVRRVSGTVVLLGTVSLLTDVSSEMVASVLPLYLTAVVGLSPIAYGFLDGMYQGVSALVRIAGGYVGDRGQRPKWVAVTGYAASALSRLAMLPAAGFAAITAVVTVDRLGKGLRTAPRDALIAAASQPDVLGRAFGVHRALDTLGAAIGPLVAFALLAAVPGSYGSIFVVSFAFAVAGVAVLVLLVPDLPTAAGAVRATVREVFSEIAGRGLRRPLLAAALLGLLTIGDGFLYLLLQERDDFTARYFPLLYVGTNVAYLALAVPLGLLADRVGRGRVLVAGHLALLGAYLFAALPRSGVVLTLAVLLLLGTFYAATDGVLAALVSRLVAARARGSGIAAAQTTVALARFAASVLFGLLWSVQGPRPALLLFAALLAVAVPIAAWLLRGIDRPTLATLPGTRPGGVPA
ncbi:MFS transporter [Micromonospora arborensis]|uniref:MFS transporter n=1 Tax=Micromonospora arborensis TaxID=2116518 RepID=UPI0033ECB862